MEDTIAAIATPVGEGGIGIVRISGTQAPELLNKYFHPHRQMALEDMESHKFYLGYFICPEAQQPLDEILAVIMRAPNSYTAEDVVEIHCHGGLVILSKVLESILAGGARLAEPGEFTKRSFLNGRIDLIQAEAVIDLIQAKTEAGVQVAIKQLLGDLSVKISAIRDKLTGILAYYEAAIDFPEDEIEGLNPGDIQDILQGVVTDLDELISTADQGMVLREGVKTVIIGKPNVGKSSLLNALLRENRAIVTDIPGTTRDVIEEIINIRGIPLRLADTAGIRETADLVEQIGVERTRDYLAGADLVLWVLDDAAGLDEEDREINRLLKNKKIIIIISKVDLNREKINRSELKNLAGDNPMVVLSVHSGAGLADLKETIWQKVLGGGINLDGSALVSNARHKQVLFTALLHLRETLRALNEGLPEDFIVIDLKAAWLKLGEVTGSAITDDLLDQIFSRFCIGK